MTNESEDALGVSDALYEMAEQAWNECWPDEPKYLSSKTAQCIVDAQWLIGVATAIIKKYDGPLSDIADHLGDFGDRWIEKRAEAILEDAREAEAQARADSREGW